RHTRFSRDWSSDVCSSDLFEGDDLARRSEHELRTARRHMQVVFQDPYGSFNPRHTVERLVSEPLHLADRKPTRAERRDMVVAARSEERRAGKAGATRSRES